MLSCWIIKRYLSAYHDGELCGWLRRLVNRHLSACDACRGHLQRLAEISGACARESTSYKQQRPPEWLVDRIMLQVHTERRLGRLDRIPDEALLTPMFSRRRWHLQAVVAAVVMISLAAALLLKTDILEQPAGVYTCSEPAAIEPEETAAAVLVETEIADIYPEEGQWLEEVLSVLDEFTAQDTVDTGLTPELRAYELVQQLSNEEQEEFKEELLEFILNS